MNDDSSLVSTVITYLEMTAPPARLPTMPSGIRLALMKAEQIPVHFYRYLYDRVGREWLWAERLRLSDEMLGAQLRREGTEVYVLYANGCPAGYFELAFRNGSCNIVYFGLMPEWIGRRIGPWFLGTAVSTAFSRKIARLTVNTCTLDHPSALGTYQRMGFVPTGREERSFHLPPGFQRG
ncbi:Acetyltransferase (GNAT) domain-containing protein [Faunimonas pinastri]|uniref:Acetyltransferase (GNAT) domain-containing protein n=1 Tax=Faunimonas pinastri TaxID=1855383 RepID=A0A1H9CIT2_9HYPH|nr:GNAT family N-acetyltransferase [Faunimonas pinastri]SEQ01112.1 Acetyltransferase (GNAT) domain-containing protein [Faunimonas pinastri]